MLVAENDPINPRLLTLERQIEDLSSATVVVSDDELKVFQDEVETNLIDPYGQKVGYIALKTRELQSKMGLGYTITGGLLLGIPWLFGMPVSQFYSKMEVEIRILDINNKLIGKFTAIGESKAPSALYYGYTGKNAMRKVKPEAIQKGLAKIRPQLQNDVERLNEKLQEAL